MNQEYFWIVSICFSGVALCVSILTAISSYKKDRRAVDYSLLEKKTDLLITVSELRDRMFELEQIMIERANRLYKASTGQKIHDIEQCRLEGNAELLKEKRIGLADAWKQIESLKPSDIEAFESMKVTYTCWLNNVLANIESERKASGKFDEDYIKS